MTPLTVSDKNESVPLATELNSDPTNSKFTSINSSNILYYVLLVVESTGIGEAMTYAGLVYYEEKRVEDLVTFATAKKLNALLQVIPSILPQLLNYLLVC